MSPAPRFSPIEQEEMILKAATKCIEASSLMDFTMSSISKECGLSMGSVYKHIQSKEDVLVALATQMFQQLHHVFTQVLALPIPAANRFVAIHLIDFEKAGLYSFAPLLETLVSNEALLQRASPGWLQKMIKTDEALEAQFYQALMHQCETGELDLPEQEFDEIVEEIQVGQWTLGVGFTQVAMQRYSRHLVGAGVELPFPLHPQSTILKSATRLMNSYPWKTPVTIADLEKACELLKEKGLR